MIEKVAHRALRTRSMHDMKERISQAQKIGYEVVGSVVETREGTFQCLMKKSIFWKDRS